MPSERNPNDGRPEAAPASRPVVAQREPVPAAAHDVGAASTQDWQARFSRLAEVAHDAIAEFDETGVCVYASDRHRTLLGRDPATLVGTRWIGLAHPDDVAHVVGEFRAARATGKTARSLTRLRHADGSYRWLEATGGWFVSARGDRHLVTVSREVGDRIRAGDETRRSEARYRAILENSPDMISIIGVDGTITFQDAVAGSVLGYGLAEIRAMDPVELVHPDDRARAFEAIDECVATPGKVVTADLRVRHRDGAWRWITAWGRNLVEVDGVDGIIVTSRDVTEQRALQAALAHREAELHQAQKMEALGRLAGGVAHDFNNLLSVIHCYADLIVDEAADASSVTQYARAIREAGVRATGLTRQLLAFSRKPTVSPRRLDLSTAVGDVAKMLGRVLGEDIRLELELATDLAPVHLDPTQLDQVILNLAVNARDAMPTGGVLTITTRRSHATGAGGARLVVADTGHGMDAVTRARAFEPFFTTKPSHKGTGLGLAMVYGVVMQAGGRIEIESQPGCGARFVVDFPPAPDDIPSLVRPEPVTRQPGPGGDRILVIEDDPAVRGLVQTVLEGRGYHVTAAASRAEALVLGGRMLAPPDLVLSDVILPDGSGPGVVTKLRTRWPEMPVLLMSGYVGDMLDARGLESCAAGLLEKPFTPDSLVGAIERALGRE